MSETAAGKCTSEGILACLVPTAADAARTLTPSLSLDFRIDAGSCMCPGMVEAAQAQRILDSLRRSYRPKMWMHSVFLGPFRLSVISAFWLWSRPQWLLHSVAGPAFPGFLPTRHVPLYGLDQVANLHTLPAGRTVCWPVIAADTPRARHHGGASSSSRRLVWVVLRGATVRVVLAERGRGPTPPRL